MKSDNSLLDWLPSFTDALRDQLMDDFERWGDTWEHRTKVGQEERTRACFDNYFDQYRHAAVPVPWLKIAGNALICWVREQQLAEMALATAVETGAGGG